MHTSDTGRFYKKCKHVVQKIGYSHKIRIDHQDLQCKCSLTVTECNSKERETGNINRERQRKQLIYIIIQYIMNNMVLRTASIVDQTIRYLTLINA